MISYILNYFNDLLSRHESNVQPSEPKSDVLPIELRLNIVKKTGFEPALWKLPSAPLIQYMIIRGSHAVVGESNQFLYFLNLSGRKDSNLRPLGPKPSALPTAPLPVKCTTVSVATLYLFWCPMQVLQITLNISIVSPFQYGGCLT